MLGIRLGGLRRGGQISTQSPSLGAAELALWPHVQFIKFVCIFQRTRLPGRFGLNTELLRVPPRELLSADRSALHILRAPVKFGTGILLLLQDQILEFYFINILSLQGVLFFFFRGGGRDPDSLFSLGLSSFPAGMHAWPPSLSF